MLNLVLLPAGYALIYIYRANLACDFRVDEKYKEFPIVRS